VAADPLAVIRQAQGSELVDEDGNEVVLDVLPPASLEEVDALEARLRVPLPTELRTVLAVTRGVEGAAVDWLELTGAGTRSFGLEDVFPAGLPIAGDGFGNFWVLDLTDQPTELAPVLYASHDPPVVLFRARISAPFWKSSSSSRAHPMHPSSTTSTRIVSSRSGGRIPACSRTRRPSPGTTLCAPSPRGSTSGSSLRISAPARSEWASRGVGGVTRRSVGGSDSSACSRSRNRRRAPAGSDASSGSASPSAPAVTDPRLGV
jgi:hypothetical protein